MSCGNPPAISNGKLNSTGTKYNDTAHYTCDEGFSLNAAPVKRCTAKKRWSGLTPRCCKYCRLVIITTRDLDLINYCRFWGKIVNVWLMNICTPTPYTSPLQQSSPWCRIISLFSGCAVYTVFIDIQGKPTYTYIHNLYLHSNLRVKLMFSRRTIFNQPIFFSRRTMWCWKARLLNITFFILVIQYVTGQHFMSNKQLSFKMIIRGGNIESPIEYLFCYGGVSPRIKHQTSSSVACH